MNLATGGDVMQIVIQGKVNKEEVLLAWENIVSENAKVNGDYGYDSYYQLLKSYLKLIAQYTIVKSLLMKCCYVIVWEDIAELRRRGFKIAVDNTGTYTESITACMRRVDNLVTKAVMKKKEIEAYFKNSDRNQAPVTFEAALANLNYALGFSVSESLTLAAFNEYKKIIRAKNAAVKAASARGRD